MNKERYSRQILFNAVGEDGQKLLLKSHVLIIGAGALGSSISEVLVRAGVGRITIIDRDYVEESNLQRQQLYSTNDALIQMPKAIAAEKRLNEINSDVVIVPIVGHASIEMLQDIIPNVDLVMDGTDNFETRLIINDLCIKNDKPWIYGACVSSYGSSFTILPNKTPCLNCLLQSVPLQTLTCDTAGILSPTVNQVVVHQSMEALKILTNNYESLRNTYLTFDLWKNISQSIKVINAKKADCLTCGQTRTYPYISSENQTKTAILCGRNTVQIRPSKTHSLSFDQVKKRMSSLYTDFSENEFLASALIDNKKVVVFNDGRVLVHNTKDEAKAMTIYQKLFA
ncbi:MAG: thiamine biosynthesis protein MoeB [Bacillales bacterium]|jgi:adenylyltransferase/sulfurtransferase|nr:thiamine biosynthesis protein MoeB [Bacillales bacterium]